MDVTIAAAASAETLSSTFILRTPLLFEAGTASLRARQVVVEIRQAVHLADVRVVDAQPALRAAPLADPVDRIRHDVRNLEDLAVLEQPYPLLHAELLGDRDTGIDVVVVRLDVARVDDERVAFEAALRLAVVRVDHRVGVGPRAAVEEDLPELVVEVRDHVDHGRQLDHRDRPDARHDHGLAGRETLADRVASG